MLVVDFARVAERVYLRLPYLQADRNDKRTAHEFLVQLVADGKKCFQRKTGANYGPHDEGIKALEHAGLL